MPRVRSYARLEAFISVAFAFCSHMASSLRGVVYPDSPRRRTRRPRAGECGIVNAMPVRRTPLHGGVLVHRRHDDAIAQGQRPQPKGREQIEPVHVLGGRPHLSHGDVDLRGRIPLPRPGHAYSGGPGHALLHQRRAPCGLRAAALSGGPDPRGPMRGFGKQPVSMVRHTVPNGKCHLPPIHVKTGPPAKLAILFQVSSLSLHNLQGMEHHSEEPLHSIKSTL